MSLPSQSDSPRRLVAIVDDDAGLRRALRRLLLANGFRVSAYESAEAYLASQERPDCLVLDIHLAGMSGTELYEQLGLRPERPPVVFITAEEERETAFGAEGPRCLLKPFDPSELVSAIERASGPRT